MRTQLILGCGLVALMGPVFGMAQAAGSEIPTQEARHFLRPGDVIRLNIWREPEMSGEFQVDETGTVVFPRLGEMLVTGDDPESLRVRLLEEYRVYLRNPSIDVTVLRRVRIMGAVQSPGLYPVDPTVSIADALALAGGATTQGNPNEIQVLRDGQRLRTMVLGSTIIGESPIRSGDVIFVPERGWVQRNSGIVATLIAGSISLVIALFLS